ncbi:MAG: peptide-methionine (S)-S-oxide reductase MsrA [Hyphomicrobiaceae bacterium]|nr:peptide-methionine (S)-S-oxide reductase MsrA [Hyphomicrobiaceae bacterium]
MKRSFAAAVTMIAALAAVLSFWTISGSAQSPVPTAEAKGEIATFAGGCFWCVESDFDKLDGVLSTVSGFMGGTTASPTYKQVTAGGTGHLEVVQVTFDPKKVSYERLVDHFWRTIDPYDAGGQFCDRGESYTTAVFTHTPEQKRVAEAAKATLEKSGPLQQPIATKIREAGAFTAAEEYHQDYYQKNPLQYRWYRYGCGRDARLEAVWGKKAGH